MQSDKNFSLMSTMLKIGCIGFGGGSALIPVIEDEIVEKSGTITEDEFNKDVMIASLTPGALPLEIAAGIGKTVCGIRGMIVSETAMALPGAVFMSLLLILVSGAGNMAKTQIGYLAAGISAFIMWMLIRYISSTVKQAEKPHEDLLYTGMILGVFILCGEENVYYVLNLDITPVFSLSTIQILGAAFFVILYTKGLPRNLYRLVPALFVALAYFLSVGARHVIPEKYAPYIVALMVLMAMTGLIQAIRESTIKGRFPWKKTGKHLMCWGLFVLILSVPAILCTPYWTYILKNGFISSIMSFGGGDAYLTTAQGLFVDNGMLSYEDFYGNIVTVANVLPGSILCKILTGISFTMGYALHHSVLEACALALCGFATAVASSGFIFEVVDALYEKYEELRIFAVLKHFIRPIISGLLVDVVLSLYSSCILPRTPDSWPYAGSLLMALFLLGFNILLSRQKKVHFAGKVLISGVVSLLLCNFL